MVCGVVHILARPPPRAPHSAAGGLTPVASHALRVSPSAASANLFTALVTHEAPHELNLPLGQDSSIPLPLYP